MRGLGWLTPHEGLGAISGIPDKRSTLYDGQAIAKVFDSCLATNHVDAWTDVAGMSGSLGRMPDAVLDVLCIRALEMPTLPPSPTQLSLLKQLISLAYAKGTPRAPAVHALIERTLAKGDTDTRAETARIIYDAAVLPEPSRALLRRMLDDEATVVSALACLVKWSAEDQIAQIEPLLKSANERVRISAARALATQLGASAIPKVIPLLTDTSPLVRTELCALARDQLPEKAFVPALLELLRDSSKDVREAAKSGPCQRL